MSFSVAVAGYLLSSPGTPFTTAHHWRAVGGFSPQFVCEFKRFGADSVQFEFITGVRNSRRLYDFKNIALWKGGERAVGVVEYRVNPDKINVSEGVLVLRYLNPDAAEKLDNLWSIING